MNIKDVLTRIGYIRHEANLSARELSLRLGMSQQYVSKVENGHIVLTVEKLFQILEICNCSIEKFFSTNIEDFEKDKEIEFILTKIPSSQKQNLIELLKNK